MPFNAIHRAHHGHGFAVALLALRETALVRFLLRRLAGCLPKTVFTHHDAFAVFAHDQRVSGLFRSIHLAFLIELDKVFTDLHSDFFALALGNLSTRGAFHAIYCCIKGVPGHFLGHPLAQSVGIFVSRKIQLTIQRK
jgi:hypothetical protein